VIREHDLTFCPREGEITGGYAIARQLWERKFETRMVGVAEMSRMVVHVAHGTAAVSENRPLHHRAGQAAAERRAERLLRQPWVDELRRAVHLDAA
jgi:hypothetical protein